LIRSVFNFLLLLSDYLVVFGVLSFSPP